MFTHHRLPVIAGADIRFAADDVIAVHTEMTKAAADRNIWLVGGGDLVGQFHDHGLLDELILGVAPVILGAGAPLLPRRITAPLKLTEVTQHGDTFVMLKYDVVKERSR